LKAPNNSYASLDPIAFSRQHLDVWREDNIHSRTEFHQSDSLPHLYSIAGPFPQYQAPGDNSRDLADDYRYSGSLDRNDILLVLDGGDVPRRDVEGARFVLDIDDFPSNRRSIYVDVERREKDGNLRWRVPVAWFYSAGAQDPAIGWRNNYIAVPGRLALGVSKKERHKGGCGQTQRCANP